MSRHTPEPWVVSSNKLEGWGLVVYVDSPSVKRRVCLIMSEDEDEQMDTARIIADAPETVAERDRLKEVNADLLAALKELVYPKTEFQASVAYSSAARLIDKCEKEKEG